MLLLGENTEDNSSKATQQQEPNSENSTLARYEKLVIWRVEIVVVDVNAVDLSCQFRFAEPSSSSSLELLSPSFHPFSVPFPTKLRAQHTHFSSSSFHPVRLVCIAQPTF